MKRAVLLAIIAIAPVLVLQACQMNQSSHPDEKVTVRDDPAASRAAFAKVYVVLMSPRCMNCHPSGDQPLQGDDSHIHTQNVQRGSDGMGMFAMKCANCHQEKNVPGVHTPPGNPKWHLPRADMKLVFQGKTPAQLAAQMKDPRQNGGKSFAQLIDHVTNDDLVKAGWNPGEGRTLPPMTHDEFAAEFRKWLETGAAIPQ